MEILKYTAVDKGNLQGFLNLRVSKWGVTINDISVFHKNNSRWINLPAKAYEVDGEKRYFPYIMFDTKELKEAFGEKVNQTLADYLKDQPQEEQQPIEECPF